MNGNELFPNTRKPSNPLEILQAELEGMLQLMNHTVKVYESSRVRLRGARRIKLVDLGYIAVLCNMGLVSAVASWEGFKGNIIRRVRERGLTIHKNTLEKLARETETHERILEPCERRDCITHSMAKVDSKYLKFVTDSRLVLGDSLD
ncbi:MAG: hypothetical protein JSV77_08465, partial [Dehalococcoidales bacterium]